MRQVKQGKNVVRVQVKRAVEDYELDALMDRLEVESFMLHQARHRGSKGVVQYTPSPRTPDTEVG